VKGAGCDELWEIKVVPGGEWNQDGGDWGTGCQRCKGKRGGLNQWCTEWRKGESGRVHLGPRM